MRILIEDFNAKVGKEGIFKPVVGNESVHDILVMIMVLE
jgi:hypothetical protein